MTSRRPAITILVHRDGDVDSRSLRIPLRLFRAALISGGILAAAILLGIVLYAPILGVAAQVPGLRSEIAGLRAENAQIRRLVATVDSLESQYSKVRGMLGADVGDRMPVASPLPRAPIITIQGPLQPTSRNSLIPTRWPLDDAGYITRGQLGAGEATHSGLDIAVPTGTPVRSSGGGTIIEAAEETEYGRYVLIRHQDGFETRYAHLSRLLVSPGHEVRGGEVIGLSGNSGRSSAPHLHFEIRRKGESLDPLTLLKEGR